MENKSTLAKFLNTFLLFVVMFIIANSLISKITRTPITKLFLSIILSFILLCLYNKIATILNSKKQNAKIKQSKIENTLSALKFSPKKEIFKIIKSAISKKYTPIKNNTKIIFKKDNNTYLLEFNFQTTETTLKELENVHTYATNKNMCTIYLSNSFSPDALTYAKLHECNIFLLDQLNSYNYLKHIGVIDNIPFISIPKEKKQKITLINALSTKNIPKFLKYGLIFLLLSFIMPIKNYYMFFAIFFGILIILSIIVKKPKKSDLKPSSFLIN